ncbi:MAG: hypothetical protein QOH14_241 [Pseudonocardiales bacterium]|nr:hypothetical protein [Pseudonocardiales bacterium]
MPAFTRAELDAAFEHYQQTVRRAAASGDWALFAELFTEDADYNEHAYGRFSGQHAIRRWVVRTMTSFPGSSMTSFPIGWHVVDEERGWIVCEVLNRMADPGDGSLHEEPNLTILHYAGGHRFSYEEDVYNPGRYLPMVTRWARVAAAHDRLPDSGRAWLDALAPGWLAAAPR